MQSSSESAASDAPQDPSPKHNHFEVLERDLQRFVMFDATGAEKWASEVQHWVCGTVQGPDGPRPSKPQHYVLETLYRHPGGYWTLLSHRPDEDESGPGPGDGPPFITEARRLSDSEAVCWLAQHKFELPPDVSELGKDAFFAPGPPIPFTPLREPAANDSENGQAAGNAPDVLNRENTTTALPLARILPCKPNVSVTWQNVAGNLESERRKGEPFTSQAMYAKRLGCSSATVNKAIQNTPTLQEWAKRPVSSKQWAQSIDGVVLDTMPQRRESDPSAIIEQPDADTAMAYLLNQASPDERARIHAMSPAQQRELAELAYKDPDRQNSILDREVLTFAGDVARHSR